MNSHSDDDIRNKLRVIEGRQRPREESSDLMELVRVLQGQQGTLSPQTLEQLLLQQVLNPNRLKVSRTVLAESVQAGVLSETREGTVMNPQGFLEEIQEQKFFMLDDGTSTSGVVICQTCGGTVKESNLKRCPCGQTVCLRKGCAKGRHDNDLWYCSTAHRFWYWVGFSIR